MTEDGIYPASMGYQPDPTRLSPNGAKKLLEPGGPAKFQYARTHPQKPKAVWDFGKLVHLFVLGEGDQVAPIEFPNYTTKDAREQRDKAYETDLIPALTHELDAAKAMADAVHSHPLAGELLADGSPEQWLYATGYDLDTDAAHGLRMRVDWMTQHDGRLSIVEFKTAADASPQVFARKAYDFGYHLAFAFAVTCARLLELDDSPAYLYIVAEKEPPYLVSVCELDAEAFLLGRKDMQQALDIYRRCTDTGDWPGYGDGLNPIRLPPWAFKTNQPNQPTIGDLLQVDA